MSVIAVRGFGFVAVAAALTSTLLVPSAARASTFTTVTTSYGADSVNQALTVYEPTTGGTHPAILFVHGGCWMRGTLVQAEIDLAQEIAADTGWVVATMTYRLTQPKYVNMPADVAAALNKLQTGGFGVDPARVALWGESAGGHLSLLTGMKGTGAPGVGRPKAVVSVSGPVDMRTELASDAQVTLGCIESFEGGLPTSQAMLNRYWSTSAIGWIDKTDPPVFLANAVADPLVPVEQPLQLKANLAAVGVPATLALVANDHHSTSAEHDMVAGGSATVVQSAIAWLRTRL